jgi:hypothetical protein
MLLDCNNIAFDLQKQCFYLSTELLFRLNCFLIDNEKLMEQDA